jgi:hypothetical protein
MKYRACRIRRPPVLKSRYWRLVSDQFWMARGEAEAAQEIPEVVRDDPQKQPHLIGPEAVTGEPRPVGGFLTFLDPLLGRPALVVEADHGPVRPSQGRDDEAHPGKELPEVMLNLGDHPPRPIPGRGLILKAPVPHQWGVARSAAGPGCEM